MSLPSLAFFYTTIAARVLPACIALSVTALSGFSWASETCHIDPLGGELPNAEVRRAPFYDSIDECETANMKNYGGRGRCHCLPNGFLNRIPNEFFDREQNEIWNSPQQYSPP
jgi:hypothetical protein